MIFPPEKDYGPRADYPNLAEGTFFNPERQNPWIYDAVGTLEEHREFISALEEVSISSSTVPKIFKENLQTALGLPAKAIKVSPHHSSPARAFLDDFGMFVVHIPTANIYLRETLRNAFPTQDDIARYIRDFFSTQKSMDEFKSLGAEAGYKLAAEQELTGNLNQTFLIQPLTVEELRNN